jgi:hypothetical protein
VCRHGECAAVLEFGGESQKVVAGRGFVYFGAVGFGAINRAPRLDDRKTLVPVQVKHNIISVRQSPKKSSMSLEILGDASRI